SVRLSPQSGMTARATVHLPPIFFVRQYGCRRSRSHAQVRSRDKAEGISAGSSCFSMDNSRNVPVHRLSVIIGIKLVQK
ncbi:MAG: hypothetical protein WCJ64_25350, partial [Rhodospirillaceae bacterium]